MAVNFNDRTCGFFQREVVDFINKQILRNGVSPHFYSMQLCESWGDMEKKLRDVLTNSAVAEATKEACAWKTLAQAVRVAQRQKWEDAEKVKKLQDQLDEQKLFTNVLVGTVNRLRDMQEREKKAAQLQLQESLTALRGVEEERNLLRNELLRAVSAQSQKQDGAVENKKGKEVRMFGTAAEAAAVPAGKNSRSTWKDKNSIDSPGGEEHLDFENLEQRSGSMDEEPKRRKRQRKIFNIANSEIGVPELCVLYVVWCG